jgi:dipeptidyl aminopeptidase/acylaminoacyl peptidase
MSVDPVDDCTLWYTTEFMNANSGTFEWSTRIAAFQFNGCAGGIGTTGGGAAGRIVFVSSRDGNREIYSMDAGGQDVRRLTNNPSGDYSPAVSADGKRIVFVSERDGRPQVYSMNTDGSDQRRVSSSAANDEQPVWIPAAPPSSPETRDIDMVEAPVAVAAWGGEGAALRTSPRGLEVEFGCATATLEAPLPASGDFDIPASYVEQRPGPRRIDIAPPVPQRVRLVGRVENNRMTVRVVLPNGQVAAEHQLERGRAPRVVKCVSP